MYFWGEIVSLLHSLWKEAGVRVFAGLAPSSQPMGSLLRTPLPAKPTEKN